MITTVLVWSALAAVPESTMQALDGRDVTLTLRDGREAIGTLEDASGGNVVLITPSGDVLTTPLSTVAGVRVNGGAGAPAGAPGRAAGANPGAKRNELGLTQVPERPPSKDCTWTRSEGASKSRHMESPPKALVPYDYGSSKLFKSTRVYDEDGNVYRATEAANIVWSSGCCPEERERWEMYQRRAVAWSVPAITLMLLSAPVGGVLGWPFVVPELIATSNRDQALEDAVYEYNRQGGY